MSRLTSSVLIVAPPTPDKIQFGADMAPTLAMACERLQRNAYAVVSFASNCAEDPEFETFLHHLEHNAPLVQKVIIHNHTSAAALARIINLGNVHSILNSFHDVAFESNIQKALERYSLLRQNVQLLDLVNQQNETLRRASIELEERVEKRQKFLEESRLRLLITNDRSEALHRALVAVHQAHSVGEMERLVNEALANALHLSWIRIFFREHPVGNENLYRRLHTLHIVPLALGKNEIGRVLFARDPHKKFSKDEMQFLNQLADTIALAIDRLSKLAQAEQLKQQWEATFDAILEPVSLVDSEYTVLRINKAYANASAHSEPDILGRKCYQAFFGHSQPCEGCHLGQNFRLKATHAVSAHTTVYDVSSHAISQDLPTVYVHMYRDVSEQLRAERQILESAKMVELGTIGSSIAHELNNPLGGMLNYLQLIKMDLKGNEAYYNDIDEMEKGAQRCRDIVKNLLGFTRKSAGEDPNIFDAREATKQALKITELQTRSIGIAIHVELPEEPVWIQGQFNLLAQALRNFLQNAQEAISEALATQKTNKGLLRVRVLPNAGHTHIEIDIQDNGIGLDPQNVAHIFEPLYTTKDPNHNPGLGLTIAQQIIRDLNGTLAISSRPGQGAEVKISLPIVQNPA